MKAVALGRDLFRSSPICLKCARYGNRSLQHTPGSDVIT